MSGMRETQLLEIELVNKSIHKPHRVIRSHLIFKCTEESLVTVSGANILPGVTYGIQLTHIAATHSLVEQYQGFQFFLVTVCVLQI